MLVLMSYWRDYGMQRLYSAQEEMVDEINICK